MFSMKTLLKVVLGIGLLFAVAYAAFPQSRAWIAAAAPFLLLLPLVLCCGMMGMKGMGGSKSKEKKPDQDDGKRPM